MVATSISTQPILRQGAWHCLHPQPCEWPGSGHKLHSKGAEDLNTVYIIEEKIEVKLPTVWTDGKAEVGRVREEKESVERRSEKESEERGC